MFQSLKKFMALPDYVQVWSAHGAGSACGKALGAVHSSTVGYEKIRNWALQFGDNEAAFIEALLEGQPEPPKYFAMMKRLNKVDRPLVLEVPKHPKLSQAAFLEAYENGVKIIDTRHKSDYAAQHVVGTYNIQGNNSFANWMGWILNYDEPFVLIANEADMDDLSRKLMRIGLDNCQGFISEIPQELPLSAVKSISLANLKEKLNKKQVQIVDVRGLTEYQAGHIAGADHVFLGTLENNLAKVSRNKEVIIHCQAGDRSSIAYSILERQGYTNVLNYAEGMKEWQANEPVVVG
jgi:hydroxyacylglutathione hydrolase